MHRPGRFVLTLGALLALALAGAAADDPPQSSGTFESKNTKLEVTGAYAFPGKVGLDDEQGIVVAVSNVPFNAQRLNQIWDRRHMIDAYFVDDETAVVYFQFAKNGEYKGLSYYFGPGDGLGFGFDSKSKSTVKIAKGRVAGGLKLPKQDEDDAFFDLKIDVPLAPADYGKPLPPGGGEPGKVYAAYHKTLDGDDPQPLESILIEEDAKEVPELGKEILEVLREQHPTKSYKIVKGFVDGDHALLLVEGENGAIGVKTEVHFRKEKDAWRLDDEIMQVRLGE